MTRDRRLLVVGEDFGRSPVEYHSDMYALTGASGRRLAALAGLFHLDFYLATERTNVVELPEQWRDSVLVERSVSAIFRRMAGRRTILLGSKVGAAFRVLDVPLLEWDHRWGRDFARFPHPSGRSHWWNDAANAERARAFLTAALA